MRPASWRFGLALACGVAAGCESPASGTADGAAPDAANPTAGWVSETSTDLYVNRCVRDPQASLERVVTDPSYVVAYRSGGDSCSEWAPTTADVLLHHQGIQRLVRGDHNYLIVTSSVHATSPGTYQPGFEIVSLGSTGGVTGALGSLAAVGQPPSSCADRVAGYLPDPGARDHAGGLQVTGAYAIVPFEDSAGLQVAGFRAASLEDPASSAWGPLVIRERGEVQHAGAAAMTRLGNGQFLALVFGFNSANVEVFTSTAPSLPLDGAADSAWQSRSEAPTLFGAHYQNLQLVTRCDGQLFVVGTAQNLAGEDSADLWQLELSPSYAPTFTLVASRHFVCSSQHTGGVRYCNFAAGAGVYVDGDGALLVYGVEHYNDAVPGTSVAVKVREFP